MNLQKISVVFLLVLLGLGISINTSTQAGGYRISAPVSYKNLSVFFDSRQK